MTHAELIENPMFKNAKKNCRLYQCAWARGYISRKNGLYIEEYKGRYGTGYKVHAPSWQSTQYHHVEYYIRRDNND